MIIRRNELRFVRLPGRLSADPFLNEPLDDMSTRVVIVDDKNPRTPHRHLTSYEFMYVVAGKGYLWEEGSFSRIEAGDCLLIPAGASHATIPDKESTIELVCCFPQKDIANDMEELNEPPDLRVWRERTQ